MYWHVKIEEVKSFISVRLTLIAFLELSAPKLEHLLQNNLCILMEFLLLTIQKKCLERHDSKRNLILSHPPT